MNENNNDASDSIDCDPSDTLYELGLEMNKTNGYPDDGCEMAFPEEIRNVSIELFGQVSAKKQVEFMARHSGKAIIGSPLELINNAIAEVVDHNREGLDDWVFGNYSVEQGWSERRAGSEDRPDGEAEAIAGME